MRLVESKQKNVTFSFCPHPVTIDKSEEWGEGNVQEFPNGVFFKHDQNGEITHGVQPNLDTECPVGWFWNGEDLDKEGNIQLYDKLPIWVGKRFDVPDKDNENIDIVLNTLDGIIRYGVNEPCYIIAQDEEGEPSEKDRWVMTEKELKKNYNL